MSAPGAVSFALSVSASITRMTTVSTSTWGRGTAKPSSASRSRSIRASFTDRRRASSFSSAGASGSREAACSSDSVSSPVSVKPSSRPRRRRALCALAGPSSENGSASVRSARTALSTKARSSSPGRTGRGPDSSPRSRARSSANPAGNQGLAASDTRRSTSAGSSRPAGAFRYATAISRVVRSAACTESSVAAWPRAARAACAVSVAHASTPSRASADPRR